MTATAQHLGSTADNSDDGLVLDREGRDVWLDGHFIDLTRTEFDLLAILMDSPRQVLSHDQLLTGLWHSPHLCDSGAIETYVSRVRRKLGESSRSPRFIHTVRGIGYKYVPQARKHVQYRTALYDLTGILVSIEPDSEPLLGWEADEIIGTRFVPSRNPIFRLPAIVALVNRMAEYAGLQSFCISHTVYDKSEVARRFDATCRFLFDGEQLSHLLAEFVIRD